MSSTGVSAPHVAQDEEREPKLQRTQAATRPGEEAMYSREQLQQMRVGQLKQLLMARKISTDGLLEKTDLINKLLE
jgi:hypothetical protein